MINTVEDLLDFMNDYAKGNDSIDYDYVNQIVQIYNDRHNDKYEVSCSKKFGIIELKPINVEGFKLLNYISNNALYTFGYEWSNDLNKMIFLPKYMKSKEKIEFLVQFIWNFSPEYRNYLIEHWSKYTKGLE